MSYCSIYITVKDEAEARKIGRALVEEKLAACVNIHPINSIYRWRGEILEEDELALEVNTRTELTSAVINRVKALHSYEVPCIISSPIIDSNPDYLKWIDESTH